MASMRRLGIENFFARFPDEGACLDHIFAAKWGDHSPCPYCGAIGNWSRIHVTKKWRHKCRRQISPLRDTVLYRSNLSLMAWFYALFLFANSSTGMRSSFIRKQLGLGHRSAYRLCHMVRVHMATMPRPAVLGGVGKTVHIDEAYLRYLAVKGHETNTAAIVLGMACEGQIICGRVPDRRANTLIPLILSRVLPGSTIVTDMHKAYQSLETYGFKHIQINHSVAFHDFNGNTNNEIEAFWSTVRRTFRSYRQVSPDNLWSYLAEIEFRYNRRNSRDKVFEELITHFAPYSRENEKVWRSRFEWIVTAAPLAI